jgi:hypothetical protein
MMTRFLACLIISCSIILSCSAPKPPLTEEEGLGLAQTYIQSKGFNPGDYRSEIVTKEKFPIAYKAYHRVIQAFENRDYLWIGFAPKKKGLPVIHVFLDKKTREILGHITND